MSGINRSLLAAAAFVALAVAPAVAQQGEVIVVEPQNEPVVVLPEPGVGTATQLGRGLGFGRIEGADQTGGDAPNYVPGISGPGSVDTEGTGAGPSGFANQGN